MKPLAYIHSLSAKFFRRSQVAEEMEEEFRAHINRRADDLERGGLARAEAERQARIEFGGNQRYREECHEAMGGAIVETLMQDVRFAFRALRKSPGFAIAAISALALGIGANTAIFSVVNAVLLKPLTYPDADRMVEFLAPSSIIASNLACIPEFHFYQRQTSVFKDVAAYDNAGPGFNLSGDRPEQLHGIHVTEGYFRVYGAPVMLGRTFTPQEDSPHGGNVVVLSYGLWQR